MSPINSSSSRVRLRTGFLSWAKKIPQLFNWLHEVHTNTHTIAHTHGRLSHTNELELEVFVTTVPAID